MADDAREYTNLAVYARQIEDPHDPSRPNPHDVLEPVTGVFEIGVVIDGARVPIFVEKASKVVALIERNRVASPVEPPAGERGSPQVVDEPQRQPDSGAGSSTPSPSQQVEQSQAPPLNPAPRSE